MPLLIANAEVNGLAGQDVLIRDGRIATIGESLLSESADFINARGGALLPGLRDHHIHLAALAAARDSLQCGPPAIRGADDLAAALRLRSNERPGQWIRGIGYHDSVAGDIDAAWLDSHVPDTPARIQHRGGRLWILNTAALLALQPTEDDPLERINGRPSGRLYEGDSWLRQRMAELGQGGFPDLGAVSQELASHGITGVTDTSPRNNPESLRHFEQARARGELLQDIRVMGDASLDGLASSVNGVTVGEHKFHLLESRLPELYRVVAGIRQSHAHGRNVAFHCVTRTELAFALAALVEAGSCPGDRIEHASIAPPELIAQIVELGLTVVTQPALIAERGDQYLTDVHRDDQPWLYRLRAFLDAGLPLAASSDAPYTNPNPWLAMQAAAERRTASGQTLGSSEVLSPEQALAAYTGRLESPGEQGLRLREGTPANLCLLSKNWARASMALHEVEVRLTLRGGQPIFRVKNA